MTHNIQKGLNKILIYIHINNKNYSKHHKIFEHPQATLPFPCHALRFLKIQQYNGCEIIFSVGPPILWAQWTLMGC